MKKQKLVELYSREEMERAIREAVGATWAAASPEKVVDVTICLAIAESAAKGARRFMQIGDVSKLDEALDD